MLIGGGMAYTFFKAQGLPIGKSLVEDDKLELARRILATPTKDLEYFSSTASPLNSKPQLRPLPSMSPPRPRTRWASTSGQKLSPLLPRKSPRPEPSFGTALMGVFEMPACCWHARNRQSRRCCHQHRCNFYRWRRRNRSLPFTRPASPDESLRVSTGGGASLEFLAGAKLPG